MATQDTKGFSLNYRWNCRRLWALDDAWLRKTIVTENQIPLINEPLNYR